MDGLSKMNDMIAWWLKLIEVNNFSGNYDINKLSEFIALKLLNGIYNYNLKCLDDDLPNYPSIDLGDDINKIGFQITSRRDSRKFYDSLGKFAKGPHRIYTNGIHFLILSLKKKPRLNRNKCKGIYREFDPEHHILNVGDLLKEIKKIYHNNREKFDCIKKILDVEIPHQPFIKKIVGLGEMGGESGLDIAEKDNQKKSIFISYSHRDMAFVKRLAGDLENIGMKVWQDEKEIKVGDPISRKVEEGITGCDFFCLVLSSNSIHSTWVEREYNIAINAKVYHSAILKILPILMEEVQPPRFLRDVKYANFSQGYDHGLSQLLEAIKDDYMRKERKSMQEFFLKSTIEELDQELVAIGADGLDDIEFKFSDSEGTPSRKDIMTALLKFYTKAPWPQNELSRFSTLEFVKALKLRKTDPIR